MLLRILMLGVNQRLATFLFLSLITSIAAAGIPKLRVDAGLRGFISADDPHKPIYERIISEFGSDNRIMVFARDPGLWTKEKLSAMEALHHGIKALDFVERVDDIFSVRTIRGKGGKVDSGIVLEGAPKDQAAIDQTRSDALYNPFLAGNFISEDGTALAMMISVRQEFCRDVFDTRINESLERSIAPLRPMFQEIFQVGSSRMNMEMKETLFSDLKWLVPLSAFTLFFTTLFFLRSAFAAAVPLAMAGVSIIWTFGMMGWTGTPLNILSAMLPSLVAAIGCTEDIHMLSSYFLGLSLAKDNHRAFAVRFMLTRMGAPCLLAAMAIAMGFVSNVFTGMELIRDFALVSAFAIAANGVVTVLLLPMILSFIGPLRHRLFLEEGRTRGLPGLFVRIFGLASSRFPKAVLWATALLCVFFLYHSSRLYVTNDPLSYLREDRPLIRDVNSAHRHLSGTKVFYITLESDQDKAFQHSQNILKLARIQEFLKKQGIFDQSVSLADQLSLVNREFHGGRPEYYRVPESRNLIAQYLLFFQRKDLEAYVSQDFRRANIIVRHKASDSNSINRNIRELEDVVAHIAGGQMNAYIVGENLMINAAAEKLMSDQAKSLFVMLAAIFIAMSAMFTSYKGGLISLAPNLIPVILMFGAMGLLKIPLNPGVVMVAVISIGMAVDWTIYLFSRYTDFCGRTSDYGKAIDSTVREEAAPMVAAGLALAAGFGVLLQSNFTVIAQFGAMSAAVMLLALFVNLLITPVILSRTRLVGLHQILALNMQKDVLEKSPLFNGMSDYQIRKAIVISELREFEAGKLLLEQGTVGRSMYLILSGRVEIERRVNDGVRQVAVLEAGQIFGEIGYVAETRRTADVKAMTNVSVLRFDYQKLSKDLKFFPNVVNKLNFNISLILSKRLTSLMDKLAESEDKKTSIGLNQ